MREINKIETTTADFSTGTLTDVVAVNNGLELLEENVVYQYEFDDIGSWKDTGYSENPTITFDGTGLKADGGEIWYYDDIAPIPYDPTKLYEISGRVKQYSVSGDNRVYIGVEGLASDGVTMININGDDSHSSQHYIACASYNLEVAEDWKTFRGYFTGNSSSVNSSANDPTAPSNLYTGVEYFRPMFLGNYNGGTGSVEIDYIKIKEIDNTTNYALNKTVSASDAVNFGSLDDLVDYDRDTNNYVGLDSNDRCYMEIDLEEKIPINQLGVFHYYKDNRTYHDTETQVSEDGNNWITIFDSNNAGEYTETSEGKWHGMETREIRYIRDYLNGSTSNSGDHWVEIEAYGYPLYKNQGERTSPQLDLSAVGNIESSTISWQETLNSQTITIETSVDGGTTWDTCTNGGSIPNIVGASTLDVRQTLSTTDTTATPVLESLEVEIIAFSGLFQSQTERLLKTKYIYNLDTERNLFQKKEYYYETKRNLSYLIKLDFDIIRQLQFQMPFLELETLRLLHLSNELQWENKLNKNLEFPVHYWNYIEKMFSQFGTGEHIVTKAFEDNNDYLGLTDDYDFCWGPVNEGEGLDTQEYPEDWETDPVTEIKYTTQDYGYNEYSDRLWGVYQASIGKIYLLKANEDLTGWDRNELLTFAPTGSQKATIEFNPGGHYEIAVEITVAGTGVKEIWLMSYPYDGSSIRKICNGSSPTLVLNHNKELVLFYGDQEQTNIYYRLENESYNTEHSIDYIFEPERTLDFINAFKIDEKEIVAKPYPEFSPDPIEYSGKLIVFYKRDDDYKPYKYTITDELYRYVFKYKEPVLEPYFDDIINSIDIDVSNLTWEDMRYLINLFSSPEADIYIEGQKEQESISTTLNTAGEGSVLIIPYNTVYKLVLEKEGIIEDSWGLLIFNNDETKMMDINVPFLGDDSKPVENNNIDISISNILWDLAGIDLNIHAFNQEDLTDLFGTTITIEAQREQPELSDTADAAGNVVFNDVIPYETVYQLVIEDSSLGTNRAIGLLNNFEPGTSQNIELPFISPFVETNSIDISTAVEWETMYITTAITLKDLAGNPIDSADITIEAQRDMPEINLTTDVNGQVIEDLLVYDTAYNFIISKTGYVVEDNLSLLVENIASKARSVDMYISDGEFDRSENNSIDIVVNSVLWLEV